MSLRGTSVQLLFRFTTRGFHLARDLVNTDLAKLITALHPDTTKLKRQNMQRVAARICGMSTYIPGYLINFKQVGSSSTSFIVKKGMLSTNGGSWFCLLLGSVYCLVCWLVVSSSSS